MDKIYQFLPDEQNEIELRVAYKSKDRFVNHLPQAVFEAIFKDIASKTNNPVEEESIVCNHKENRKIVYLKNKKVDKTIYETKTRLHRMNLKDHNLSITVAKETPLKNDGLNKNVKNKLELCRRYRNRTSVIKGNWRFDFTRLIDLEDKSVEYWLNLIKKVDPIKFELEIEYVGKRDVSLSEFEKDVESVAKMVSKHLKNVEEPKKRLFIADRNADQVWKMTNYVLSLGKKDVGKILSGYSVSEKADGERKLLFIDSLCDAYLIAKADKEIFDYKNKLCGSILDGEYVNGIYYAFDILFCNNVDVRQLNLIERHKLIDHFVDGKIVKKKKFYFDQVDFGNKTKKTIFDICAEVYQPKKYPYELDGLIFTPINAPYTNKETYKWKPPEMLTIDFLIKNDRLYSAIDAKTFFRERTKHNLEFYNKGLFPYLQGKPRYMPVLFTPDGDQSVSHFESGNTKKYDDKIAEMAFLNGKWVFHRFREDKQLEYEKAKKEGRFTGPNDWSYTTYPNWLIIKDPVTEAMITGKEEIDMGYYVGINRNKAKNLAPNLPKIHNYMKEAIYAKVPNKKTVLELAGGRGGDMYKYFKFDPEYVLFTNLEKVGLDEAKNKFNKESRKTKKTFKIDFLNTNLRKNEVNRIRNKTQIDEFDLVSCHFAMHYFLESEEIFKNFFKVVDTFLKKGGYFIATTFDGQTVFDLLKENKGLVEGKVGDQIVFSVKKEYKDRTLKDFGQKILVNWLTIGEHPEYLVNYDFLIKHFEKNGYELVQTAMFSDLYKNVGKNLLNDVEKAYSFMNRYIVFKKF